MIVRMQDCLYCPTATVLKQLNTVGKSHFNLVLIAANKTNTAVVKHWKSINEPCSVLASLQYDVGAEELCPEKSAAMSMLVNHIISEHISQQQLSCLHCQTVRTVYNSAMTCASQVSQFSDRLQKSSWVRNHSLLVISMQTHDLGE